MNNNDLIINEDMLSGLEKERKTSEKSRNDMCDRLTSLLITILQDPKNVVTSSALPTLMKDQPIDYTWYYYRGKIIFDIPSLKRIGMDQTTVNQLIHALSNPINSKKDRIRKIIPIGWFHLMESGITKPYTLEQVA